MHRRPGWLLEMLLCFCFVFLFLLLLIWGYFVLRYWDQTVGLNTCNARTLPPWLCPQPSLFLQGLYLEIPDSILFDFLFIWEGDTFQNYYLISTDIYVCSRN